MGMDGWMDGCKIQAEWDMLKVRTRSRSTCLCNKADCL